MQLKKDHVNFAVGPVQISPEIAKLGAEPVPYFRTDEFSAMMKENEVLVKKFFHAEEKARAVFLTGSGTAAMEAAVTGVFTAKDKLLIINGGNFGQRFCEICSLHNIPFDDLRLESGQALEEGRLLECAGKGYTGLLVNLGETSTGIAYNSEMLGRFCRENGMFFVVDAVSAFLADPIRMEDMGIDIVLTGSQKALALPPGISIVVLSERACQRVYATPPKIYYLNMQSALKNGERGQTPFTPAVGILIQLNARLNEINAIGADSEQQRIKRRAERFRERIKKYPLRFYAEAPSNAVTSLTPLNPAVSARRLFEVLKNEYDIIVCPNGGELADSVFRVGHIGELTDGDYEQLYSAFDDLMKRGILLE